MAESTVGLIFRLRSDSNQAKNDIKQLHRTIVTETAEAGKTAKSNLSGIGDLLKIAGGNLVANAISTVTSALISGGKAVLDYSSNLEQTKIGFETLLGSGEKATKLLKEIQDFAKSTPFEFQGIAALSQRLLGANVEASKIIPLMRDIGNIVAATGETSQERLSGVTVALVQMISKQKVSAEEMEQLAERGVNGFQLLSQATGKSQAELRKMAEQGQISSDLMIKALQKVSQEKFGDAMEKQSRTFSGAMSNIKDSIMIVASQAFEPLYKEISAFVLRFQKDIEAQGGNFRGIGNVIAQYIGEGLGQGIGKVFEWLGKYLGTRLKEIFTGENIVDPITKNLFGGLIRGFTNAVGLTKEEVAAGFKEIIEIAGKKFTLDPVTNTLKEIGAEVKNVNNELIKMPSIADKLEAEKAKKQSEALSNIILDLTSRIAFFGQESEVAAAKQRLINAGITDLTTNDAERVLVLAEIYDKLEAAQKKQEEYNQKFTSFRDELSKMREDARFQMEFPNPTELDRFQNWVKRNRVEMFGLKSEIEQTEAALRLLIQRANNAERIETEASFFKTIRAEIDALKDIDLSPVSKKFADVLKNLSFGRMEDASRMNETIQGFLNTFKSLGIQIRDLERDWKRLLKIASDEAAKQEIFSNNPVFESIARNEKILEKYRTQIDEIRKLHERIKTSVGADFNNLTNEIESKSQSLINTLKSDQELLNSLGGNVDEEIKKLKESNLETERVLGQRLELLQRFRVMMSNFKNEKGLQVFSDNQLNRLLEFFDELGKAVEKSQLELSIKKLDQVMSDLGITIKGFGEDSELEKLTKFLSDPDITEALKARAEALHLSVEELKEMIILAEQMKGATAGDDEGSPAEGEPEKKPLSITQVFQEFIKTLEQSVGFSNIAANSLKILANAFYGVANAIGSVIQQWVLYGSTGPAVMRKILASALATIAAEAAVQAIYATALGFIRLAQWDWTGATNAFISAGIWASIAGVAAIAGRAVAGNAFKQTNAANNNAQTQSQTSSQNRQAQTEEALRIIAEDRANPSRNELIVKLKVESNDSHIVDVVETNVSNNDSLRSMFVKLAEVV